MLVQDERSIMAQIARFVTDDGAELLVDFPAEGDTQDRNPTNDGKDAVAMAMAKVESAIAAIKAAASAIARARMPVDGLEMEFALKASASGGFFLASADSEAPIKVKLTWSQKNVSHYFGSEGSSIAEMSDDSPCFHVYS
jgi:hypothetical protein